MRLSFFQLKHPQYLHNGIYLASNRPVLQFNHIIRTITIAGPNSAATADQAETETPLTERLKRRIWGVNLPDVLKPKAKSQATLPEKEEAPSAVKTHTDPTSADGYIPRHDGRDLRVVGFVGKLGVRKAGFQPIESFPLQDRITDPEVLKDLLRRAVLETYTIILYGRDAAAGVSRDTMRTKDLTKDVDVINSPGGGFQFIYKSNEVLTEILGQSPEITPGETVEITQVAETVQTDQGTEITQREGGVQGVEEVQGTANAHGVVKGEEATGVQAVEAVEKGQGSMKAHGAVEALGIEEAAKAPEAEKVQRAEKPQTAEEFQSTAEATEPPICSQSPGSQTTVQATSNTLASTPEAWLSLPLPPAHLFAIHKRILATTGQRLYDNALSHSPTVSTLLRELLAVAAPPPDKLDLLQAAPALAQLGNVKVLRTRIRPVDKNTEIGMLSPGVKEWLEVKRKKAAGEDVDGQFVYKWDEGKYFVA